MSWTAKVEPVEPDGFVDAVEACPTEPPEDGMADEVKAQLEAARAAALGLADAITPDAVAEGLKLAASLSGHACVEPGDSSQESITVSVQQVSG